MKKCLGCGIKLQNNDSACLGYVDNLDKDYCMRCYKLINYGIYEKVLSDTIDYQKLFKEIKDNNSLVIFLIDILMNKIEKYQNNSDVYVVGYTNAGKSSLINKIIKNYSNKNYLLTISPLPTTTLDCVKIKINENLNIIDTPGLTDKDNIINYVDNKMYKKLNSKKEINPKTFRIKKGESLIINNILRINYLSYNDNSFTFYIPNEINVERYLKIIII